ncbi:hypothetical protein [Arenibaculum sp.]|jgi:hypothetical protein|uniref:hypothetical protein n=1 Tax=Arenibaculum sp. TaxID=2865862 RepID=UPI002E117B71|nr:hypothetical protein [Arenibaculum sp.]
MNDPVRLLEEMQRASDSTVALLQASAEAQGRIAGLLAGALAAQTATVGLMIEAGLLSWRQAAAYYEAVLASLSPARRDGPESEAIRSVLTFLEDTYGGAREPAGRPRLSVVEGGAGDDGARDDGAG